MICRFRGFVVALALSVKNLRFLPPSSGEDSRPLCHFVTFPLTGEFPGGRAAERSEAERACFAHRFCHFTGRKYYEKEITAPVAKRSGDLQIFIHGLFGGFNDVGQRLGLSGGTMIQNVRNIPGGGTVGGGVPIKQQIIGTHF